MDGLLLLDTNRVPSEPDGTENLATALQYGALGRPQRARYHVSSLADQFDDTDIADSLDDVTDSPDPTCGRYYPLRV